MSSNSLPLTARSISPINAAELSSYPDRTCQICCTFISIASCLFLSSSGVNSGSAAGIVAEEAGAAPDGAVDEPGVISKRETAEDTAEFEGVLKFFEARRTFQN